MGQIQIRRDHDVEFQHGKDGGLMADTREQARAKAWEYASAMVEDGHKCKIVKKCAVYKITILSKKQKTNPNPMTVSFEFSHDNIFPSKGTIVRDIPTGIIGYANGRSTPEWGLEIIVRTDNNTEGGATFFSHTFEVLNIKESK
jgi:hypothetical protein